MVSQPLYCGVDSQAVGQLLWWMYTYQISLELVASWQTSSHFKPWRPVAKIKKQISKLKHQFYFLLSSTFFILKQLMFKNLVIWRIVEYKNLKVIAKLIANKAQKTKIYPFILCLKSSPIIRIVPIIDGITSGWKNYNCIWD